MAMLNDHSVVNPACSKKYVADALNVVPPMICMQKRKMTIIVRRRSVFLKQAR